MSTGRFVAPGRTRSCPHCKATILDSAAVCPGCHHHLRFDSASRAQEAVTPLRVDGVLRHPPNGESWEYSVVLAIRNGRGEEISRQIVGVGALQPEEERTFSLAVEVFKPVAVAKPAEAAKLPEAARAPDPARASLSPKPGVAPRPAAAASPMSTAAASPLSAAALKAAGPSSNPAAPPKLGATPTPARSTDAAAPAPVPPVPAPHSQAPARIVPGLGRRWLPGGTVRDPKRS